MWVRLFRTAALGLVTCQLAMQAIAAEVTADSYPRPGGAPLSFISVEGELWKSDIVAFNAIASRMSSAVVVLNSPGGDLEAGIELGRSIARRGFSTAVVDTCASACALAWLAGRQRFASQDSRIGFHVAYVGQVLKRESGLGNALVGHYLGELGLGESVVRYVSSAAPDDMQWLTPADARRLGIHVDRFDSPPERRTSTRMALRPDVSRPVPGFDPANVARAVRNSYSRVKEAGIIALVDSSKACWNVAREARTLDKVQYCRALDLFGMGLDEGGQRMQLASHFDPRSREGDLMFGLRNAGIDDVAVAKKILQLWEEQFDVALARASGKQ